MAKAKYTLHLEFDLILAHVEVDAQEGLLKRADVHRRTGLQRDSACLAEQVPDGTCRRA